MNEFIYQKDYKKSCITFDITFIIINYYYLLLLLLLHLLHYITKKFLLTIINRLSI